MKRLICATLIPGILALSLMGATAASAQSYRGGHGGFGHGGYSRGGGGWHGRGGDGGALLGLGIGLFALGAIAASSDRDRYDDRYDYGPPPPPAYYGRGYYGPPRGYDRGYDGY